MVGVGADGTLWDAWQPSPNGVVGTGGLGRGSSPTAASLANDTDGRLEFFGLSPAGALVNLWQKTPERHLGRPGADGWLVDRLSGRAGRDRPPAHRPGLRRPRLHDPVGERPGHRRRVFHRLVQPP